MGWPAFASPPPPLPFTYVFVLVLDDGNPLAVVPDFDFVVFRVNRHFDTAHRRIAHFVVGRVDQDFVEYLVQTRDVRDLSLEQAGEKYVISRWQKQKYERKKD